MTRFQALANAPTVLLSISIAPMLSMLLCPLDRLIGAVTRRPVYHVIGLIAGVALFLIFLELLYGWGVLHYATVIGSIGACVLMLVFLRARLIFGVIVEPVLAF